MLARGKTARALLLALSQKDNMKAKKAYSIWPVHSTSYPDADHEITINSLPVGSRTTRLKTSVQVCTIILI